jgi:transcriptional regulator with XRE-family HTH domain
MIPRASTSDSRTSPTPTHNTLLRYQRLLRGWSQQDVANELNKLCAANGDPEASATAQHVSRWEGGYCKPRPLYRKHLYQLYGLTAAELGFIEPLEGQG